MAPRRLAFAEATALAEIVDQQYILTNKKTLLVPVLSQWSAVMLL